MLNVETEQVPVSALEERPGIQVIVVTVASCLFFQWRDLNMIWQTFLSTNSFFYSNQGLFKLANNLRPE